MPDMSLLGFIGHLAGFAARLDAHEHKALDHIGKIVAEEAKHELGTYQEAVGQFGAWPSLAESTQAERTRLGFTPDDPGLRSGAMRDSIEHVVADREAVIGSADEHLEYFELGTRHQPPRSVLGMAVLHEEHQIRAIAGGAVVSAFIGHGDVFGGEIPERGD